MERLGFSINRGKLPDGGSRWVAPESNDAIRAHAHDQQAGRVPLAENNERHPGSERLACGTR